MRKETPLSPASSASTASSSSSSPSVHKPTSRRRTRNQAGMARSSLPHGLYSLLVLVLAVSGWFASLWQGDGCNYAIVSGPIVDQLDPSYSAQNPITTLELGFDSYRELPNEVSLDLVDPAGGSSSGDSGTNSSSLSKSFSASNATNILKPRTTSCIVYPDEVTLGLVDSSWTTSRSLAFFGLVLGGASTTFLCCSLCFVFSRVTWRWTGYGLLLAALCQLLSLVAWFSTQLCSWNACGWSLGSVSDAAASGVWSVCGVLVVCHYPSVRWKGSGNGTETIDESTASTVVVIDASKSFHSHAEEEEENAGFRHQQGSGESSGEGSRRQPRRHQDYSGIDCEVHGYDDKRQYTHGEMA